MYAIVKIGNSQYKVKKNQVLQVSKIDKKPGEEITLPSIYAVIDKEKVSLGNPVLKNVIITAEVIEHGLDKKIIVFKKRKKKFYEKTRGHRQDYTLIKIKEIKVAG